METVWPIAGSGGPVMIAALPERPMDRRLADPSPFSRLFVHELDDHTPCHRQDVESDRHGFRIGRGNMTRWQYDYGRAVRRWPRSGAHPS
ncbi:hypothetical protein [Sorangium sp. So ce1153]|uniref:hypothetical protein n=1 Tax=Sorangium sp. So ce1153 TaxID=3133333 RepID=UPI003F5F7110